MKNKIMFISVFVLGMSAANAGTVYCDAEILTASPASNPKINLVETHIDRVKNSQGTELEVRTLKAETGSSTFQVIHSATGPALAVIFNKGTGISSSTYIAVTTEGQSRASLMMTANDEISLLSCVQR